MATAVTPTETTDPTTPIAASLRPIAPALGSYQQIEQELSRTFLEGYVRSQYRKADDDVRSQLRSPVTRG